MIYGQSPLGPLKSTVLFWALMAGWYLGFPKWPDTCHSGEMKVTRDSESGEDSVVLSETLG